MLQFQINKDILLTEEKVLVELDIPLMLTCRDSSKKLYLGLCIEDEPLEKYLFIPVTESDIVKMMTNKVTMRDIFQIQGKKLVWYFCYQEETTVGICEEIIDDHLPTKNQYFGNCNDDLKNYIKQLNNRCKNSCINPSEDNIEIKIAEDGSTNTDIDLYSSHRDITNSYVESTVNGIGDENDGFQYTISKTVNLKENNCVPVPNTYLNVA